MGIYKLDELDFPTGANSVSSMSLSGHTNYYIIISNFSAGGGYLEMQLAEGSSVVSGSVYDEYMRVGTSSTNFVDTHATSETSVRLSYNLNASTTEQNTQIWIFGAGDVNTNTNFVYRSVAQLSTTIYNSMGGGRLQNNSVVNGFNLLNTTTDYFTDGKLVVYGYR
tara:strand:- start:104 stop:601 length:498 start_codon:yes stop_codon:yes gene_type:complete